jgi:hypothetical protein
VKLHQLEPSVAVWSLHHREVHLDAHEPHNAVDPTALDRPFALRRESKLAEKRRRGREVVDHHAHVIHALDVMRPKVAERRPLSESGETAGGRARSLRAR